MKQLRGSHRFNSYKELCAALEITPASRGKQREAQKQDIQKIQIYQEDGIRIDICDNGIGCDKKYFFQDVSMLFDRGIGMQNVYNRIVLHHGPNYGLQFHSKKGVGTSVSLHLPIIYQEGAEHD